MLHHKRYPPGSSTLRIQSFLHSLDAPMQLHCALTIIGQVTMWESGHWVGHMFLCVEELAASSSSRRRGLTLHWEEWAISKSLESLGSLVIQDFWVHQPRCLQPICQHPILFKSELCWHSRSFLVGSVIYETLFPGRVPSFIFPPTEEIRTTLFPTKEVLCLLLASLFISAFCFPYSEHQQVAAASVFHCPNRY